jgi:hypothetical protein
MTVIVTVIVTVTVTVTVIVTMTVIVTVTNVHNEMKFTQTIMRTIAPKKNQISYQSQLYEYKFTLFMFTITIAPSVTSVPYTLGCTRHAQLLVHTSASTQSVVLSVISTVLGFTSAPSQRPSHPACTCCGKFSQKIKSMSASRKNNQKYTILQVRKNSCYCDFQNKWESLRRSSSSKLVQISR